MVMLIVYDGVFLFLGFYDMEMRIWSLSEEVVGRFVEFEFDGLERYNCNC